MRITRDYNSPILEVTENGCSYGDTPDEHGRIPDQRRVEFYRGYVGAVGRAIKDGANVRGYHAWSLMDNFEWAEGYFSNCSMQNIQYFQGRVRLKWNLQTHPSAREKKHGAQPR